MAHTYTIKVSEALTSVQVQKIYQALRMDGTPFAILQEQGDPMQAIPQVIEALREALDAMERMDKRLLSLTANTHMHRPMEDKGEIVRARAALQAIGAL